ncbi:hypothetical protein TrVGV298_004797 [Trichoderma virens]|nr:hypothetical protein TrVGV298_004797 [Trichoderma virens]
MANQLRARTFGSANQANLPDESSTIIIVFLSLAFYNVLVLICIIFGTFRRYSGLYFWAFVVSTSGIALSCSGFMIKYFSPKSLGYFSCTLSLLGWVCMVTGQSLVLWSRLHLVMRNPRLLRIILWIIIIDAILCHGTVIPMVYGSFSDKPEIFAKPYSIAERMEVIIFFLQEVMISIFYIIETVRIMKIETFLQNHQSSRRLMHHLVIVNVLVILLDSTIIILEFANLYDYQISYKPFAYSVKLQLEFTVLNRLVDLATGRKEAYSSQRSRDIYISKNTTTGQVFEADNSVGVESQQASDMIPMNTFSIIKPLPPLHTNVGITKTTTTTMHVEKRLDVDSESMCRIWPGGSENGMSRTGSRNKSSTSTVDGPFSE